MSTAAKMRVLVVAPNCAPARSEMMMGYQMARAIGKYVDAVVATHCYFESSINKAGGLGQAEPAYIDLHKLSILTNRTQRRFKLGTASGTLVSFPLAIAFRTSGLAAIPQGVV